MPQHPKTPEPDEEAWCLEALREVKAGAELSRASRARLTAFGMLDGLGQPTPAGRALLALHEAEKGVTGPAPRWMTCKHDGGWQFLSANTFRCRQCNVVRTQPFGDGVKITKVWVDETAGLELKARVAALEAALRPFAERVAADPGFYAGKDVIMGGVRGSDWLTAAQVLGLLDPEPEAVRAEVGLS